MATAKSLVRWNAAFMGPWEATGNRYEASGSLPTWPVREYSALNWSTERINITDSLVGLGGGAEGSEEEVAIVELDGAEVTVGMRLSGCGGGAGEAGGGEVDRLVVTIGEVVVITGEVVGATGEAIVVMGEVMTGAEIGSEVRGGDGAIGSTGCTLSPPTTSRSTALLEISEAAVFWVARRAFFAARSASLELRGGAGCRLRAAGTGMSASTSSRPTGSLRKDKQVSMKQDNN